MEFTGRTGPQRVQRLPSNLDVDYAVYLRPVDKPRRVPCLTHDACCAMEQHFVVVGRHGNGDEMPLAMVIQEGHVDT